jgi:hypothetical protein
MVFSDAKRPGMSFIKIIDCQHQAQWIDSQRYKVAALVIALRLPMGGFSFSS